MISAIRTILVRTTHPGNIGASARALKTMGLGGLCLVSPRHFPHVECTARAAGADDLLKEALVTSSLEEALKGVHIAFGTSARARSKDWLMLSPREAAVKAMEGFTAGAQLAFVFGNEQSGLSNEELGLCHYQVKIPSHPEYASLNLASSVQIIAYELLSCALDQNIPWFQTQGFIENTDYSKRFSSLEEVAQLYQHLEESLTKIGFLKPQSARPLMLRLKRLLSRVQLEKEEIHILRGICSAIIKYGSF